MAVLSIMTQTYQAGAGCELGFDAVLGGDHSDLTRSQSVSDDFGAHRMAGGASDHRSGRDAEELDRIIYNEIWREAESFADLGSATNVSL